VHPGYGFLSENADFAQAIVDAGRTWIGPAPHAIRELGNKVSARRIAAKVNAPLTPGTTGPVSGAAEFIDFARQHGLPVAIKAAFGGGGRGLKVARTIDEIPELFESATREALAAFGHAECFVERYLDRPRHVEAQVLADQHGNAIIVGTRDCSLQRRHQKLVEEAPAPLLTDEQRLTIHNSAKAICREANYHGAGTVEYLLGNDGTISFLEVNTRLQVEHPVTEVTTGIDLVAEQLKIAAGEPLSITEDPVPRGHAIEFRINSEDPGRNFLPSPGRITRFQEPSGPWIRVDAGVDTGAVIGAQFDSLLAKLIVIGPDRATALARSRRALDEMVVEGVATVLPFHRAVVEDSAFTAPSGCEFAVHTRWIETEFDNRIPPYGQADDEATVPIGGRLLRVRLPGLRALGPRPEDVCADDRVAESTGDTVVTPMHGTIVKLAVVDGQQVSQGELIAVVEAMKMENPVSAHTDGTVTGLAVQLGDVPGHGAVICTIVKGGTA
jgi:acetyl-CoA/propionyl-CoA carboxylase biotin carboxyl carrier protein